MTPWDAREAIATLLDGTETLVVEDDSAAGLSSAAAREPGPLAAGAHGIHPVVLQVARTGPAARGAVSAPPTLHRADHCPPRAGPGMVQPAAAAGAARAAHRVSAPAPPGAQVATATVTYAARRAHVVDALAGRGITVPGTEGINIWVPVHDETAAVVRLASQGIGVAPGAPFRLGPPDGAPAGGGHLRVTVGLPRGTTPTAGLAQALAEAALAGGRPARAR